MLMKLNTNRARLPYQLEKVPDDRAGIYVMRLGLPPARDFGLRRDTTEAPDDLIQNLSRRLEKFRAAYVSFEMTTVARREGYAEHLARPLRIDVSGFVQDSLFSSVSKVFSDSDGKVAYEHYNALRIALYSLQPIYVGVTIDRSLQERIAEHLDGRTSVEAGLSENGLIWDDVEVEWTALPMHKECVRDIERIAQALHRPIFSKY